MRSLVNDIGMAMNEIVEMLEQVPVLDDLVDSWQESIVAVFGILAEQLAKRRHGATLDPRRRRPRGNP
jgi:hypothetical protein